MYFFVYRHFFINFAGAFYSDPTPTLPREGVSPWGDLEGVVNVQCSIFNLQYKKHDTR